MTYPTLLSLAGKVGALMAACRETDALIAKAVRSQWIGSPQRFTSSYEAALSIKPNNTTFALGDCNQDDSPWACVTDAEGVDYAATGATPILAFVAANLRARSALEASHG